MIISCEHNYGSMGLCSECSRNVSESLDRAEKESAKQQKLERMIKELESEGEYSAAERLRVKLKNM